MRPFDICSTNYLFAGSFAGGDRAAIAYSVLASCHLVGVNPAEYLADVLPRLARGAFTTAAFDAMAPANWKTERAAQAAPAADHS